MDLKITGMDKLEFTDIYGPSLMPKYAPLNQIFAGSDFPSPLTLGLSKFRGNHFVPKQVIICSLQGSVKQTWKK